MTGKGGNFPRDVEMVGVGRLDPEGLSDFQAPGSPIPREKSLGSYFGKKKSLGGSDNLEASDSGLSSPSMIASDSDFIDESLLQGELEDSICFSTKCSSPVETLSAKGIRGELQMSVTYMGNSLKVDIQKVRCLLSAPQKARFEPYFNMQLHDQGKVREAKTEKKKTLVKEKTSFSLESPLTPRSERLRFSYGESIPKSRRKSSVSLETQVSKSFEFLVESNLTSPSSESFLIVNVMCCVGSLDRQEKVGIVVVPLKGMALGVPCEGFYLIGSIKNARGPKKNNRAKMAPIPTAGKLLDDMNSETSLSTGSRKIVSLRTLFICLITVQLIVAVSVTTAITYVAAQNELHDSAKEVVAKVGSGTVSALVFLFSGPLLSTITELPVPQSPSTTENEMLFSLYQSINSSTTSRISTASSLYYGAEVGTFYQYSERYTIDNIALFYPTVMIKNQTATIGQNATMYKANIDCEYYQVNTCKLFDTTSPLARVPYNVTDRAWFQLGKTVTEGVRWTDIYNFSTPAEPGLTAVHQVKQQDTGNFQGVIGSDLPLSAIDSYMKSQSYYSTGMGYLVEVTNGSLFSSSVNSPVFLSPNMTRIAAENSTDTTIRMTSRFLESLCVGYVLDPFNVTSLWECIGSEMNGTYFADDNVINVSNYSDSGGLNLVSVVVIPQSDFDETFNRMIKVSVGVAIVLLFVSILIAIICVSMFTKKLIEATKSLKNFSTLNFSEEVQRDGINSPIKEISRIYNALANMRSSLKSFSKYVPPDVVRFLVKENQEACLGGEQKLVTVLFSDVVGFTEISEELSLDELISLMSEYLEEMSNIIKENEGTVDKYIGDAIMALWNAPELVEDHASKACTAALCCQKRLEIMSKNWERRGYRPVKARIGIHTGDAIVGNFGARERLNYTALGDNINLGSRLESLNKEYNTSILISQATYDRVSQYFLCRPLDLVSVKGKVKPSCIYELIDCKDSVSLEQFEDVKLFEEAYSNFRAQNFKEALTKFQRYLIRHPHDVAAERHSKSCELFMENRPSADWTGERKMHTK
eukprot:Nk52_evm40s2367 gene=Nk52_evmTU40s2367